MPALLFEVRGHVAYLTINRPEVHNAMNPEVVVRLAEAWQRVADDDEVRAAIITGAGDKAFSAGADLGRMIPLMTGAREPEDEWDHKIKQNPARRARDQGDGGEVLGAAVRDGVQDRKRGPATLVQSRVQQDERADRQPIWVF
jgi:hypothetical protein